jgi:hypothetical protein
MEQDLKILALPFLAIFELPAVGVPEIWLQLVTVNIINSGHIRSLSSSRPSCAWVDADGGWSHLLTNNASA